MTNTPDASKARIPKQPKAAAPTKQIILQWARLKREIPRDQTAMIEYCAKLAGKEEGCIVIDAIMMGLKTVLEVVQVTPSGRLEPVASWTTGKDMRFGCEQQLCQDTAGRWFLETGFGKPAAMEVRDVLRWISSRKVLENEGTGTFKSFTSLENVLLNQLAKAI